MPYLQWQFKSMLISNKLLLLRHGWVITSHCSMLMWLLMHALVLMLVELINMLVRGLLDFSEVCIKNQNFCSRRMHLHLPTFQLFCPGANNFNSVWLTIAIWQYRSGSSLILKMAWCVAAPSITWTNVDLSSVWSNDNSLRGISQEISQASMTKISFKFPRG